MSKEIEVTQDIKLTAQQERFAQLLFEGYNQSEAYRIAYPVSLNWKPKSVWEKASELANNIKVKSRVIQLKNPVIEKFKEAQEAMAQSIIDAATKAEIKKGIPDHSTRHKAAKTGLDYLGMEAPKKNLNLNANTEMSKEEVNKLLENL